LLQDCQLNRHGGRVGDLPGTPTARATRPICDLVDGPGRSESSAEIDEDRRQIEIVLGTIPVSGIALSVGAVWWAARAAGLVASLLSTTPALRHVDPLPVLGRNPETEDEDEAETDQDKRADEYRARWVLDEQPAQVA
jgi:hypothetical protein